MPLYYQVMRVLKDQIVSGRYETGAQLPSESELTESFGVSRVVVRQALQLLEEEGLIRRVKGKGTFVSPQAERDRVPRLSGYLEDLLRIGLDMEVKLLDIRLVKASGELAEMFQVEDGAELFFFKRLRLVEDKPFSVIHNYVPYRIGQLIPPKELEEEPLMQLIESRGKAVIDWASEVFQAVAADEETARLLEIDLMSPVLKMILTAYSPEGDVLNLAHVYYRSDRYNYRGYLKRRRTEDYIGWSPIERSIIPGAATARVDVAGVIESLPGGETR
ncbi:MAG: GntR family transcriptional regulator [Thermoleophilia bacterium]